MGRKTEVGCGRWLLHFIHFTTVIQEGMAFVPPEGQGASTTMFCAIQRVDMAVRSMLSGPSCRARASMYFSEGAFQPATIQPPLAF